VSKYITPGTVTAVLSIAAIVAGAFGKSALATFLNDPSTTQTILTLAGSIGTLAAGLMNGVKAA
jgi:hypothetical protein